MKILYYYSKVGGEIEISRKTVKIKCLNCNKEFEVTQSEVNRGYGKFCSRSCAAIYRNKKRLKAEKVKLICQYCGNTYTKEIREIKQLHKKGMESKYCSIKCLNASKRKKREVKNCLNCSKEFEFIPYKNNKFCSIDCVREYKSKNKNICKKLKLRFLVLERDNFTCQYCGRTPSKDRSVILEIDHIIPKSKGGTDDIDNLITSCKECNLGKGDIILIN
jgi:5-methylcytosine-specific restriction endonuclease McrA